MNLNQLRVVFLVCLFGSAAFAQPNPVPQINQLLSPDAAAPGGPAFVLKVNGSGFVSNSVVNWNGAALATGFVNATQLTANVPAANIAAPGTALITAVNPGPGGGTSAPGHFHVTRPTASVVLNRADYPATGPFFVTCADVNGDGKLDLIVANQAAGSIVVLLGNGDGTFVPGSPFPGSANPVALAVGDLNGDGRLDLIAADGGASSVEVFLGNGDGTFQSTAPYSTSSSPNSVMAADFNGDGKLDIATANSSGQTVSVLLGNGDGTFQGHVEYPVPGNVEVFLTAGDFNQDGKLDLAVVHQSGDGVAILLGNGDGSFQPYLDYSAGTGTQWAAAGDYNGDGILDLAVANSGGNSISVLMGNGNGTFQAAVNYATGQLPHSVAVGDFNGDGKPDLVTANAGQSSSSASVLLGKGDGTFQTNVDFPTGAGSVAVAAGDFNRDGRLDVVVANQGDSNISVLLQAPLAKLSGSNLAFGTQVVGTSSATKTVTVANTGSADLTILTVAAAGDFSETDNCAGAIIPAGSSCMVSVTFSPTAGGVRNGTITITDNAGAGTQVVNLSGGGTAPPFSLSLSPTTTIGGNATILNTITLTNPAPAAGLVFSLSSTNGNVASVPPTVTVPPNATVSANFTITTFGVATTKFITITATFADGSKKTGTLTVSPATISGVNLSLSTIAGGAFSTVNNVALTGAVSSTGAVATLTSSNPAAASVPATLYFVAGSNTSPNFVIKTSAVATPTVVTITANYLGVDQTASLTVSPPFGNIQIQLASSVISPQPLGTTVVWTATAVNSNAHPVTYKFEAAPPGSSTFSLLADFSLVQTFKWTPGVVEGTYQIRVTARDYLAGISAQQVVNFTMNPLVAGTAPPPSAAANPLAATSAPLVSATANPLVALFSAAPCPAGTSMRVAFAPVGVNGSLHTDFRPCLPGTMNFYIAGMAQHAVYSLHAEVRSGSKIFVDPRVVTFTTGGISQFAQRNVLLAPTAQADTNTPILLTGFVTLVAPPAAFPVATSLSGAIVWYYPNFVAIARPVTGGTMLVLASGNGTGTGFLGNNPTVKILREIDLAGNTLRETNADRVAEQLSAMGVALISHFHHDAIRLPNGHTIVLGSTQKVFPAGTQGSIGPVDVTGLLIVELDENFQVVASWNAFDHAGGGTQLDINRRPVRGELCTLNGSPWAQQGCPPVLLASPNYDWLHTNSVQYEPQDGSLLISMRNQDWLAKIDYGSGLGTGNLIWRMGAGGDFTMNSNDPFPWFSGQHDAGFQSATHTISLFDNGNTRVRQFPGQNSRGQVLSVDENAKTVSLVLNADLGTYSSGLGSAQPLPNGNYTFQSGLVNPGPDVFQQSVEVAPDGTPAYRIQGQAAAYRSWRVQDLYTAPAW